jgi:HAD superfamily hydrolase (TIGR01509 family)
VEGTENDEVRTTNYGLRTTDYGLRTTSYDRPVPIETLFLDAGGVLVHPNWERVADALARHGVTTSADALRNAEPHAKRVIDEGTHIDRTTDAERAWLYMDLVFERAGVAPSTGTDAAIAELAAYHAAENLWEHVPDDVVPALQRLREVVPKLVVVSNANGVLHKMLNRVGLSQYFDVICDSCVERVEKPDPRYFQIALERSRSRADATTHVGDLYHVDVVGARRAGLGAILLDSANLYPDADCVRVRTLAQLVERICAERAHG